MCVGLLTYVDGERSVEPPHSFMYLAYYRESKTQEADVYMAEGKIPIEVDLSQHPEKSIESRACAF